MESKRRIAPVNSFEWNTYITSSQVGLAMHRYEFLTLLANAARNRFIPLGIFHGERLEAVMPLIVTTRGPFKIGTNHALYDGLVIPIPLPNLVTYVELLRREAKQRRIGILKIPLALSDPLDSSTKEQLERLGYDIFPQTSFVLDLSQKPSRQLKNNLKVADRGGIFVERASEEDIREAFPVILESVFSANKGIMHFSFTVMEQIWHMYHSDPAIQFFVARIEEGTSVRTIGVALVTQNGRVANLWKLAVLPDYKMMHAGAALEMAARTYAIQQGCGVMDTGSAPTEGIRKHKRAMGAVEVPFYYIRCTTMPTYHAAESLRRVFRSMQQKYKKE